MFKRQIVGVVGSSVHVRFGIRDRAEPQAHYLVHNLRLLSTFFDTARISFHPVGPVCANFQEPQFHVKFVRRAAKYVDHYVRVATCYIVPEQLEDVLLFNVESPFLVLIDPKKRLAAQSRGSRS